VWHDFTSVNNEIGRVGYNIVTLALALHSCMSFCLIIVIDLLIYVVLINLLWLLLNLSLQ
jgi:hypothetical protein